MTCGGASRAQLKAGRAWHVWGTPGSMGLDYRGQDPGREAPPGAKGACSGREVRQGSSSLGSGPSAAASPSQEAVETLCACPSRLSVAVG